MAATIVNLTNDLNALTNFTPEQVAKVFAPIWLNEGNLGAVIANGTVSERRDFFEALQSKWANIDNLFGLETLQELRAEVDGCPTGSIADGVDAIVQLGKTMYYGGINF